MLEDEGRESGTGGTEDDESQDDEGSGAEADAGQTGAAGEGGGADGAGDGDAGSGDDAGKESDPEIPDDFDPKRALKTIRDQREAEKKLKEEAKTLRTQLRTAKQEAATLKAGAEGEAEELRSQVTELETKVSELTETVEGYRGSAREATFLNSIELPQPDVAYSLVPRTGVELQWDDKDQPTNLKAVRRALVQKYPHLFGDPGVDGGADRGVYRGSSNGDMNELLRGSR